MVARLPEKQSYSGPITDTSRWDDFEHRQDDIFICTPVKCGTTWTQAICAMLVFGTTEHGRSPNATSPWIDAKFEPIDDYLKRVDAQDHRRFFKTHTPFDAIPYFETCTYLVVLRDPRDAFLSGLKHRDNWNDPALAHTIFPSGDNPFSDWLYRTREPGEWDIQSLEYITHFFKSFWDYRTLPNVHLYHYSQMLRDLRGTIRSMAAAASVAMSDQQLDQYTAAGSFASMKSRAEQFAPFADIGMWKQNEGFFATGLAGQWKAQLTEDQLAAFEARIDELLDADEIAWLLDK